MKTTKQVIAEFMEKFNLNYQKEVNNGYFAGNEKIEEVEQFITSKLEEKDKEKTELAIALVRMYEQYCKDGHEFMTAGEMASTVLEMQGYAGFDDAGRLINNTLKSTYL